MNRLNWKLLAVLSLILALAIGINSIILYRSITRYSDAQLRLELSNTADEIVDYIEADTIRALEVKNFSRALDLLDYQVAIVSTNRKRVLYTNTPGLKVKTVIERDNTVFVTRIITNEDGDEIGNLVLISKNGEIQRLKNIFEINVRNSIIFGVLLILLFMVLLILLVNRPLNKIIDKMSKDAPIKVKKSSDWYAIAHVHNEARLKRINQQQEQNEFFQNASHELKSPLMNIQGVMEGMEDGIYESSEASQLVVAESQRIKMLVDQMIRTSKAAGVEKEDLLYEMIDLKSFMTTIGKMVPKDISFTYTGNKDQFYFDASFLEIIISNLVQNACRYAKHSIEVNYHGDSQLSEIVVRDDGPGIDKQILGKIFQRFVKGRDGKTGLGLAIVERYVTATGGTIDAYNDGGAVFKMKWTKGQVILD